MMTNYSSFYGFATFLLSDFTGQVRRQRAYVILVLIFDLKAEVAGVAEVAEVARVPPHYCQCTSQAWTWSLLPYLPPMPSALCTCPVLPHLPLHMPCLVLWQSPRVLPNTLWNSVGVVKTDNLTSIRGQPTDAPVDYGTCWGHLGATYSPSTIMLSRYCIIICITSSSMMLLLLLLLLLELYFFVRIIVISYSTPKWYYHYLYIINFTHDIIIMVIIIISFSTSSMILVLLLLSY